ncbi:MAG: C40 family peptidase [Bacilli bacterium]|nr:C40 family peptidase [Bacilli bacterium]
MKNIELPSKIRFLSLMMLSLLIMFSCYTYHNYYTYKNIKVVVKNNAAVPYGSANYNLNDFIKKVDGEIVSVKNDIDTNVIGKQEVLVEVKKENIIKEVPIVVSVVDTLGPTINIKDERFVITEGDEYDLNSNIESVVDDVDGDIPFNSDINEESVFYYNISYNGDEINNIGEHEVKVIAKDKTGNYSEKTFIFEVEEKKYYVPYNYSYNAADSIHGNDAVSIAYSLLGAPYIGGANGPYGFDCSGFVQYVYSNVGVNVSRSSWTQLYDGVGVSYDNAQPGDILSWGYGGTPTHSALYVGNGMMIHAANPSQGVILSSVDGWLSGSGTTILSVRRVN